MGTQIVRISLKKLCWFCNKRKRINYMHSNVAETEAQTCTLCPKKPHVLFLHATTGIWWGLYFGIKIS